MAARPAPAPRSIVAQCMETHSRLHGKSQPRLLQTYLFMKCEVMKKVLNPTTVLTLTVLSRSVGNPRVPSCGATPARTPRRGQGTLPPTYPTAGWAAGGSLQGSTAPPCTQPTSSSQAPCKAQNFAGDLKWLQVRRKLTRVGKGVTRMRKGKKKQNQKSPVIANGWFGELQGGNRPPQGLSSRAQQEPAPS